VLQQGCLGDKNATSVTAQKEQDVSMRPRPAEVEGWFSRALTDDELTSYLSILHGDPN
jgi:hypothetical protein